MSQVPMLPYKVQTYRGVVDTHKTVLPLQTAGFDIRIEISQHKKGELRPFYDTFYCRE